MSKVLLPAILIFTYAVAISSGWPNHNFQGLAKFKRETNENGCILPSHPLNGRYTMVSGSNYEVNRIAIDSIVIVLKCDEGYIPSDSSFFFCNKNTWEPRLDKGYCSRKCPALHSTDTYDVNCTYKGELRDCNAPIQDTIADIKCKPSHVKENRGIPICRDGVWNPAPQHCAPECGQKIVNAQTLVIGGSNAEPGEYPWVLAIYRNADKQHICGATMISRIFVLSAAHCFHNHKNVLLDKSEFIVAAGKYYRDLDKPENGVQIREIKELRIHEDYRGAPTKYRDNIAVIEVEKLDVTQLVRPVCIDWSNEYENSDFVDDTKAAILGWKYTFDGVNQTDVLQRVIVPYRSKDVCKKFMDPDFFNQYYSSDKICAGSDDQEGIYKGMSGAGLFFRSQSTTFYVRGVLNLAPSASSPNSNTLALYAKVSKYLPWLERVTRRRGV